MTRTIAAPMAVAAALVTAVAFAQTGESTGSLPPVAGADEPPPAAPAPGGTASAVAPQPQPPPPPGAAPPGPYGPPPAYAGQPAPPPGFGYPPGGYRAPYGVTPEPPPPPPTRTVSLTLSPIHLLFPIFEANIEVRIVDHFAVAAIGGFGTIQADSTTGPSDRFDAQELGGQLIGYPSEAFDGLQVGAELLYVHVSADDIDQQSVRGVGSGWAVGPMVGYKYLARSGFTFVAQGGLQYVAVQAEASDTAGNTATDEESRWIPLLNLNLGWSF